MQIGKITEIRAYSNESIFPQKILEKICFTNFFWHKQIDGHVRFQRVTTCIYCQLLLKAINLEEGDTFF